MRDAGDVLDEIDFFNAASGREFHIKRRVAAPLRRCVKFGEICVNLR